MTMFWAIALLMTLAVAATLLRPLLPAGDRIAARWLSHLSPVSYRQRSTV